MQNVYAGNRSATAGAQQKGQLCECTHAAMTQQFSNVLSTHAKLLL